MVVRMSEAAAPEEIERVLAALSERGCQARRVGEAIVVVSGRQEIPSEIGRLPGVQAVIDPGTPYKLVHRSACPEGSRVRVGPVTIGGPEFVVAAGPCAIESETQMRQTAAAVAAAGAGILRGGAFKPRTSPYSFRGLGEAGLRILVDAGRALGMPVVTEVLTADDVALVAAHADILQIGARNMQNYVLLEAAGASGKPVLLKRGLSATVEELLLAAEYIALQGNLRIILCERGIRTFESALRNTLDLAAVVLLRQLTHLPVIVDPSHATGRRDLIAPLAKAAAVVGAAGLMVEVHPDPESALSDGPQSITFDQFSRIQGELAPVLAAEGRCLGLGGPQGREAHVRSLHLRLRKLDAAIRSLEEERLKTDVQIGQAKSKMEDSAIVVYGSASRT